MSRRAVILGVFFWAALIWSPSWSNEAGQGYALSGAEGGIPFKQEKTVDGGAVIKSFVILLMLLGAAAAAAYYFKRTDFAKKLGVAESRHIELVELRRLSPKSAVYLLKVHDKHYLLAQAGDHVSLVEHAGGLEKELPSQTND